MIFCCCVDVIFFSKAQYFINLDTVGSKTSSDNLYNKALFTDSLASSFCIIIKKEVRAHKHLNHTEHVFVLEGKALMKIADRTVEIKKGDMIFIPKNTVHSVTTISKEPLKVLSWQAPFFDGKDRYFVD